METGTAPAVSIVPCTRQPSSVPVTVVVSVPIRRPFSYTTNEAGPGVCAESTADRSSVTANSRHMRIIVDSDVTAVK